MSENNPTVSTAIPALGVSVLRTAVPTVWGSIVTWIVTQVPAFEILREQAGVFGLILLAAATAGWYALWRKIEPKLPDWLRAATLGYPAAPAVYAKDVSKVNQVEVSKAPDEDGVVTKTLDVSGPDGVVIR